MYTRAAAIVLAFLLVPPAHAGGGEPHHERYVADALEIVVTPTGESVTRLVSRKRQTVRQFWVESAHPPQGTLLVILEPSRVTRAAMIQTSGTSLVTKPSHSSARQPGLKKNSNGPRKWACTGGGATLAMRQAKTHTPVHPHT